MGRRPAAGVAATESVTVRYTPAQAARIDVMRGEKSRAHYLREVELEHARRQREACTQARRHRAGRALPCSRCGLTPAAREAGTVTTVTTHETITQS